MRGEKFASFARLSWHKGSPPHARGKVEVRLEAGEKYGITPACAGKSGFSQASADERKDHPRMRGEK